MMIIKIIKSGFIALLCCAISHSTLTAAMDYEITASLSESYDDNVTYAESNEKDDFITRLSLGGKGTLQRDRHTIEMGGTVTQNLYAKNSEFNNNSQNMVLSYRGNVVSNLRIDFSDHFRHAEEPRSFEDELGRTAGRYSYYQNTARLGGTLDVSPQLQCELSYGHDWREISKDTAGPDSQEHSGRFSFIYFLDSSNIATLFYEVARRTYEPGGEITRQTVFLNGRHYFKPYLYLDAGAGYDFFDSVDTKTEPQFSVSLTNQFSELTYVSAAYIKRYYVQTYNDDLFDEWRASLELGHQIYERLNLNVSTFAGRGEYQRLKDRDTFYGLSGQLNYDITQKIRGYVSYVYRTVSSNRASREYDRSLISVGISLKL
jgi:hypothetical protein